MSYPETNVIQQKNMISIGLCKFCFGGWGSEGAKLVYMMISLSSRTAIYWILPSYILIFMRKMGDLKNISPINSQ
jgi:hypothetical protein